MLGTTPQAIPLCHNMLHLHCADCVCSWRIALCVARAGLAAGQVPAYVSVIDAVACRVESQLPGGENFHWNLDGELVHAPVMEAEARHGLVHTFARGVER